MTCEKCGKEVLEIDVRCQHCGAPVGSTGAHRMIGQVKSRFLEEAKALAALDHPNIVHLYNFGQENGYFVLAMQFVQGRTWERMILENQRQDWKPACKIAVDVLRALEYAHGRGVVH